MHSAVNAYERGPPLISDTGTSVPLLSAALEAGIRAGFAELLPAAKIRVTAEAIAPPAPARQDATVVLVSGPLAGALAIVSDDKATRGLAHQIVQAGLGDGAPPAAADGTLTELEEGALCELCNRIGAVFVMQMPAPEEFAINCPALFHGDPVQVGGDHRYCVMQSVRLPDLEVFVWLGLSPSQAQRTSTAERMRTLAKLRARCRAGEQ